MRLGLVLILVLLAACAGDGGAAPVTTASSVDLVPGTAASGTADPGGLGTATTTPAATNTGPPATPSTPTPVLPTAPAVDLEDIDLQLEPVISLEDPIALAARPGDEDLLYVAQQDGLVRVLLDGVAQERAALDLRDRTDSAGEQGLLGMAFSLDGTRLYVHYTLGDGDAQIDEFAVDIDGRIDPASRRPLLRVEHSTFPNHNGGSVVVGPDGMLYLGMGDGGGGGDPFLAGQDLSTPLGKILRIDPTPSGDREYTIPADNPFLGALGEIWSYGLRNPWRFSFDRETGDLWVGDVGQNDREEVNWVPATGASTGGAGANFGWSAFEGTRRYHDGQDAYRHVPPVWEYGHDDGNLSVTGGFVYRGTRVPALLGAYVFGDYGSGRIWALRLHEDAGPEVAELARVGGLASFGEDAAGELYVLSHAQDTVYRLAL